MALYSSSLGEKEKVMAWALWGCLSPEKQKELIKAGWEAVKEKPVVVPVTSEDTAMEDLKEISRLMREPPKNVKRESRW